MEVKDSKPAKLQEMIDIPLQAEPQTAAQRSSEPAASTNGETVTGKRKREGSSDLTNEHNSKRVASGFVPGVDSNGPIVLDDDDEGAILIDD
jgi:hypothetical protein